MNKLKLSLVVCILFSALFFTACGRDNNYISLSNFCFDTTITISIYDMNSDYDENEIINECFNICDQYDCLFSKTNKDSEIFLINNAGKNPVTVSDDVVNILSDGIEYGKLSKGAFDITINPLSELWNITENDGVIPNKKDINNALSHVNYKKINIDGNEVSLSDPDSSIDLGGIAKGFVADKLKKYMTSKGVSSGIIDLGGDVLVIGKKSEDTDFTIGIKRPFSNSSLDYSATISISDMSVVTSGIYERYFESDGKIYHHILDTYTGYPVENNLYSVTVITDNAENGDALATIALSLGRKKGMEFIDSLSSTEAVMIDDKYNILVSNGLFMDENNEIVFNKRNNKY